MTQSMNYNEINPCLTENTCDEPEASLMPLEDYQHSNLVPLEMATETIKSLFRNLPRDVWIAKNASKKPADSLTPDESAAIHLYTMELKDQPLYLLLNKLLRDRDRRKLKPWFPYLKLFLTALFKLPTCSAKIVWRGVKAALHSKYHRGEHYTWWSFSSCTLSLEVLEQPMYLGTTGERTLFSIECLNGKNIKPHSYYKTEDEILLLPGFYFKVVSKITAGNGLHIIQLREVVPPFVLLEPPFGIQQLSSRSSITPNIDSILDKVYEMNKGNDDMCKLFVVLPNPVLEWNPKKLFENEYVFHSACECSTNEMHFACYPAYAVPNPRVFFQIYGEYMRQLMIPPAQHLFDRQIIDKYHDTRFWSVYKKNLDKIVQVLDVIASEAVPVIKANDTSTLKELLMPDWLYEYSLCPSITTEMSVRWVCINHYPADQLNLMHELDDVQEVKLNINRSSLVFNGEIDSTQISRVCDVFGRGLRLYQIKLSDLRTSASSLQKLTRTLSETSRISIYFSPYFPGKFSDNEKIQIGTLLKSCNEIIASNPGLKHVAVDVNGEYSSTNNGMVDVLKSNKNLRSFSYGLQMTSKDVIQMMSVLKKNQTLTRLALTHHTLSSQAVQTIAALIRSSPTLIDLTLINNKLMNEGMQIIVDATCSNPLMKKLSAMANELSDESAPFIIHLLQTCSSVTSLNVSFNKITVLGARWIFEVLERNRTVLHLDISYNDLSIDHARKTTKYNGSIMGVGEIIGRLLLKNTTLCTLDISEIKVSDNDLRPLAEALLTNRTLAHLTLSEDKYSSTSCKKITHILHWNCPLIGLNLSSSTLDEVGIRRLSEILQKNNKLQFLKLQCCSISDNGISIIAQALKHNRALSHIDLAINDVSKVGVEALAEVLRNNTNITYLNISYNKIGDDGVKTIAHALFDNHTLTYIGMRSNKTTDVGGQAMAHALKSNDTLFHLAIISGNELSSNILTKLRTTRRNLIIT